MSFLTPQVSSRLANPGLFENQIRNYFRASNNVVQQSKTIADRPIYDAKNCDGQTEVSLFTGAYNQVVTNLEGSYVQPSSEHVIIYGIMFHTDNATPTANFALGECVWQKGFTTGNNPVTTGDTNSELPAPALNITLQTNGVVYLREVWGGDWDSDLITQSRGVLYLNVPVIWAGQTSLEVTVATQDGSAFPLNYSIRCELLGIGLI
jgi:hypothetical protein